MNNRSENSDVTNRETVSLSEADRLEYTADGLTSTALPALEKSNSGASAVLPAAGLASSISTQIERSNFSLLQSVGGIFGIVVTVLPSLVFMISYEIWGLNLALGAAILAVAIASILALILRKPFSGIISAVIGVGISVIFSLWSGSGTNFYVPGLLINLVYALILFISILVKHDLIGEALQIMQPKVFKPEDEIRRRKIRAATTLVSGLWAALFALRVFISAPLYYADATTSLGIARLVLGVPLSALVAWLSWLILRPWYANQQ